MEILLPSRIYSNFEGYCNIIDLLNPFLNSTQRCDVIFNFSKLKWYDANLLPIIGVCIENKKFSHNLKYIEGSLSERLSKLWGKNGFGKYFKIDPVEDIYNSTIAYSIFKPDEGKKFGAYVDDHLLSNPNLPQMSSGLRKQISLNIQEIFGNAPMHGNCKEVLSCGQHFPSKGKLLFTIANLGYTIQENVIEFYSSFLHETPPDNTISWAVVEDNSTKPMINGKSGGKGLAYLHEFIHKNAGKLQICSGNEYWESTPDGTFTKQLSSNFPGTIVTIEINLKDKNTYILKSELKNITDLF